jgi:solute carrier family 7 (L-type amino acid transporter), member 6
MGALNANMFATAKLCVAAAHRKYFPAALANMHCTSAKDEEDYLDRRLRIIPTPVRSPLLAFAEATRELRWDKAVPM